MSTRYFTDGTSTWKFPAKGQPQHRDNEESHWEDSAFANLAAFSASPGDTTEVSPEKGEPAA